MARVHNGTTIAVSPTVTILFTSDSAGGSDGNQCKLYEVQNTGSTDIEVNVTPLHRAGEYYPIAGGTSKQFGCTVPGYGQITSVTARCPTGTSTVVAGPLIQ